LAPGWAYIHSREILFVRRYNGCVPSGTTNKHDCLVAIFFGCSSCSSSSRYVEVMGAANGKNSTALSIQHFGGSQPGLPGIYQKENGDDDSNSSDFDFSEIEDECDADGLNPEVCYSELEKFLKYHEENVLYVNVSEGNTEKSFLRGTSVYFKIEFTGDKKCTSSRKYDEFVTLAKVLRKRMQGISIPALPKGGIGDDEEAIQRRIKGLKAFLQSIVRHPFLRFDTAFEDFMQSDQSFTKKRAKSFPVENSPGVQNWQRMIRICRTPRLPVVMLKALNSEISLLKSFYKNLVLSIKAYSEKLRICGGAVEELGGIYATWGTMEKKQMPLFSAIASVGNGETGSENLALAGMIVKVEESYKGASKDFSTKADELMRIVKGPIRLELIALKSFKKELHQIKHVVEAAKKACDNFKEADLKNFKASQPTFDTSESVETPKASNRSTKIKSKRDEAYKKKRDALKTAHTFLRGLLLIELQRFRHERTRRISAILMRLGKMNLNLAEHASSSWTGVCSTIPETISARSDLSLMVSLKELVADTAPAPKESSPQLPAESVMSSKKAPDAEKAEVSHISESDDSAEILRDEKKSHDEEALLVRAIQSFKSEHEGECDINEGDVVEGEYSAENPEWFWVKDKEGYVPSSHVEKVGSENQKSAAISEPHEVDKLDMKQVDLAPAIPRNTKPAQESEVRPEDTGASVEPRPQPKINLLASIQSFDKSNLLNVS